MAVAGTPTLDQLKVFITVVEVGSFAGAARALGRTTSVVSYTITNLEALFGFSLFMRDATRRPVLTAAGLTVLSEARAVTNGLNRLRAKAQGLLEGLEPEVTLVLDVMLPESRVIDALRAFRIEFPSVALHVRSEGLGAVTQLVIDGAAMIGVCGPPDIEVPGLQRIGVGSVQLIPVAAPDHPLAVASRNLVGAGRDHLQVVLTDRSDRTKGVDLGVVANHTWRVADLRTKHLLLLDGVGWGAMPAPMVRQDLEAGRLVKLDLPDFKGGAYRFFAIYRANAPLGPAASFLVERFAGQTPPWVAPDEDCQAI
ncbi:LysR family transcriptional regulator [Caulobacter radicis]|uniref:LysR family transcriptional regulator n=1 Tax=Caulobacter radicis TaxID=2172650 RepID=A0A2T9JM86_9CAUL|nr:LysR family transcriptional regulator [Caulobacter radicis]PVM84800.1 LysR family transcriptional regulator [Caulobacter radicis]